MFTVQVDDAAVLARLDSLPDRVRARLEVAINTLAQKLRKHVIQDKLLGQVLNRVTGDLGRSIQETVESSATGVVGTVYSSGDVVYGRIHEYGATFTRRMSVAWGKNLRAPHDVTYHYPERSFMRSSLADMRDDIVEGITNAVEEGSKL